MDDGKITAEEVEQCKKEGREVIQAVAQLLYSINPKGGLSAHFKR